jgi:hypothetical protein
MQISYSVGKTGCFDYAGSPLGGCLLAGAARSFPGTEFEASRKYGTQAHIFAKRIVPEICPDTLIMVIKNDTTDATEIAFQVSPVLSLSAVLTGPQVSSI